MTEKMLPDFAAGEVTLLSFEEIEIPTDAARKIQETIELDYEPDLVRTWNGTLIDLTPPQMRKYRVTLTCSDMGAPALDGVWTGRTLTVNCISDFGAGTISSDGGERNAVEGSEREEGGFNYYRPQLVTMVESYTIDTNEWDAIVGWTLVLREV